MWRLQFLIKWVWNLILNLREIKIWIQIKKKIRPGTFGFRTWSMYLFTKRSEYMMITFIYQALSAYIVELCSYLRIHLALIIYYLIDLLVHLKKFIFKLFYPINYTNGEHIIFLILTHEFFVGSKSRSKLEPQWFVSDPFPSLDPA